MTPDEGDRTSTAKAMSIFGLIFLLYLVVWALCGCGPARRVVAEPEPTADTAFVPSSEVAKPELALITAPATSNMPAIRVDPPEPAPTTTIVNEFADYACGLWGPTALEAGWTADLVPKLLRTVYRESRCQPEVRSTTSDSGLAQINDIVLRDWRFQRDWPGFDPQTLFDPLTNLRVAWWLFMVDGWTPWRGGA